MKIRHGLAALATVLVLPGALTAVASPAVAGGTYQYSFQEHQASDTFQDQGICTPGVATINLINYNEAIHVTASQAGLSQDAVEALLESNSPLISKVTYTQTGSFHIVESDLQAYDGHFTSWFGGSVNSTTTVFTGVFNLTGTSTDGRQISGHFLSHVTFKNGEPVIAFDKGTTSGC